MHLFRQRPVLFWLRWLVILVAAPAWAATMLGFATSYVRERSSLEQGTVATARILMQAIDRDLAGAISAIQVLALSPYLRTGDIAAFREQALEVLRTQTGNAIALVDPSGEQVMSTLRGVGEPLPRSGALDLLRKVLEAGAPAVSDFYVGGTSGATQVGVGVPVIRDDGLTYVLTMGIRPQRLVQLLRDEQLSPDWVVGILDRNGTIIARTHDPEQFLGQKGPPALLQKMAESGAADGSFTGDTLEGVPVLTTFSRSRTSGWTVAIGIPTAGLTAELRASLATSVAATGATLLIALLLARRLGLRIAGSIQALSAPARALASGTPMVIPPLEIREVDQLGMALTEAGRLLQQEGLAREKAEVAARQHLGDLAHFSRVSLAGEMAAGIAHELNQPLTAIAAYASGCVRLLRDNHPSLDLLREGAAQVAAQATRATQILGRLRRFVVDEETQRSTVGVGLIIETALGLIATEAAENRVVIGVAIEPKLPLVLADRVEIEQVLINLLRNAIDAMTEVETKHITVTARRTEGGSVEVSVADSGPGIDAAVREKLFQPFVTTKLRGMGMGLSLSHKIIEAHGGRLRLVEGGHQGAVFVFDLPTRPAEAKSHAA
jgi:signal transduction histidine kinase